MKTFSIIAQSPADPYVSHQGIVIPPDTILIGFAGIGLAVIQWLIRRELASSDRRVRSLESRVAATEAQTEVVEKDVGQLRAQLPNDFVRRDDWIRFSTTLESKLDALHRRLDDVVRKQP